MEYGGEVVRAGCVVEYVLPLRVPEALVQVAAIAVFLGEGLCHEARRQPIQQTQLLYAVPEEQRAVGGLQSRRMAQVHLVHALAVLAIVALDWHAVRVHHAPQPSDDELVAGGTVQAVAAGCGAERREVAPAFRAQRALVFAPDTKLKLQRQLGAVAHISRALEHAAEHVARGDGDGFAAFGHEIADDGGDALLPGNETERREVGHHAQVGVAAFPVSEAQARHELLGDVPAKEHIALREAVLQAVQEHVRRESLAAEYAVIVGSADLDGVYRMLFDELLHARAVVGHDVAPPREVWFSGAQYTNAGGRATRDAAADTTVLGTAATERLLGPGDFRRRCLCEAAQAP